MRYYDSKSSALYLAYNIPQYLNPNYKNRVSNFTINANYFNRLLTSKSMLVKSQLVSIVIAVHHQLWQLLHPQLQL